VDQSRLSEMREKRKFAMLSRRDFLVRTSGGVMLASSSFACGAEKRVPSDASNSVLRVKSASMLEQGLIRTDAAGGPMAITWGPDDRQFAASADGPMWPTIPEDDYHTSELYALKGTPQSLTHEKIKAYPRVGLWDYLSGAAAPYYCLTMLAVDGILYQYLSTGPRWANGVKELKNPNQHFSGAKLVYSSDAGRTWRNQDGSTPVVFELPNDQNSKNMVFLNETLFAFSIPSILQMGRNYEGNRDGYIYVYGPNGVTEGSMNEVVLCRVPKGKIRDRAKYEFFVGMNGAAQARWSKDVTARVPVHTFPSGYVTKANYVQDWMLSVAYNAPLSMYMMISGANGAGGTAGADGVVSTKSCWGIWIAQNPWGPWHQIFEDTKRTSLVGARIAPKWISEDGRSFWLVLGEGRKDVSVKDDPMSLYTAHSRGEFWKARTLWGQANPGCMSIQRVDLIVG
jgi:hypothetical protein